MASDVVPSFGVGMKKILLFLILVSCSVESQQNCLVDCDTCAENHCHPGYCGIRVVVSQNCSPYTELVEVAIDDCVYGEPVLPGTSDLLCLSVEEGSVSQVTLRSDDMFWFRELECTDTLSGGVFVLTADCEEAVD